MDNQMSFEQFWDLLCREMASPQVIRNWTEPKGYFGENFVAQQHDIHIICVLPSKHEIQVPKEDFEAVYQLWSEYVRGRVPRKDVVAITFHSKYIISILHQLLDKQHYASTPEPEIVQGENPEQSLQQALMAEVHSLLTQAEVNFILLEGFGLDIAAFIQRGGRNYVRMIEVKAFVGSRAGGVGIGSNKGSGSQVDLLLHSSAELKIVDSSIRWVLGMGTLAKGSPRYAVFTSDQAKQAVMGDKVARGKQNNLRISDFQNELVTWDEFLRMLRQFLLE